MDKTQRYRWCFVPLCKNTQLKSPHKLFIQIPKNENIRNLWFKAAHRPDNRTKYNYYCFEDHFNLKKDMENYTRYMLRGGPIKMKQGVVPHFFNRHPHRTNARSSEPRPAFLKLNRKRMIASILADANKENVYKKRAPNFQTVETISSRQLEEFYANQEAGLSQICTTLGTEAEIKCDPESSGQSSKVLSTFEEEPADIGDEVIIRPCMKKHYRSKAVIVKPSTSTAECLAKPVVADRQSSQIIMLTESSSSASATMTTFKSSTSHSEYHPSLEEMSDIAEGNELEMKQTTLRLTNYFITTDSISYTGINRQWLWIIEEVQTVTKITSDDIKLTFMKIKKNDTFKRLGDQFDLCGSVASKVFEKSVQEIAHVLERLIYYPDKISLKENLPIPFRLNFSDVAGIIDCFEIQIEKSTNALHQALTWSEYKKCDTLKYLICISPDGLITFISTGYVGRVSDICCHTLIQ